MKKMVRGLLSGLLVTAMLVLSIPVEVKAGVAGVGYAGLDGVTGGVVGGKINKENEPHYINIPKKWDKKEFQLISVPVIFKNSNQYDIIQYPASLSDDGKPEIESFVVQNRDAIYFPEGITINNAIIKSAEQIDTYRPSIIIKNDQLATSTETILSFKKKVYNKAYNAALEALKNNVSFDEAMKAAKDAATKYYNDYKNSSVDNADISFDYEVIAEAAANDAKKFLDNGNSSSFQLGNPLAPTTGGSQVTGVHISNLTCLNSNITIDENVQIDLLRAHKNAPAMNNLNIRSRVPIGSEEEKDISQSFDTNGKRDDSQIKSNEKKTINNNIALSSSSSVINVDQTEQIADLHDLID